MLEPGAWLYIRLSQCGRTFGHDKEQNFWYMNEIGHKNVGVFWLHEALVPQGKIFHSNSR